MKSKYLVFFTSFVLLVLLFSPLRVNGGQGQDLCPPVSEHSSWHKYNTKGYEIAYQQRNDKNECIDPKLVICGNPGQPQCNLTYIFLMVKFVFDQAVKVYSPILAILLLAYAGIKMIWFSSSPDKAKEAKNIIKYVLIGLAIIWGAWFIVDQIAKILGWGIKDNQTTWWKISY